MNEYNVSDYGIFTSAVNTIQKLNQNYDTNKTVVSDVRTRISDGSVFMGPAADSAQAGCVQVDSKMNTMMSNLTTLSNYLKQACESYKTGDQAAASTVSNVGSTTASTTAKYHLEIPSNIAQAGYTVTCYGPDGWHLSGKERATPIAKNTSQEKVHNQWVASGARYKNGIAVMNINGQDHYLIATSQALGKVGDTINVNFENGQTIPCLIADAKSSHDSNYTQYGHARSDGSINVLEFEVDRQEYLAKSNPSTQKWGLEWDSSSDVKSVDNFGSILSTV